MALVIKFQGLEADRHQLEASEGLESLAGLGRAATQVGHYVATGDVRHRRPFDKRIAFYFQETRPGSLDAILGLGGALVLGAAGNATYDLLKEVWRRATGLGEGGSVETNGLFFPVGDVDALTEAVSPSILRGHQWIQHPQQRISVRKGREILADLTQATKEYMVEEISAEDIAVQDVSVGALNVNSKYGKVFFQDLGRLVSFRVAKDAAARTIPTLAQNLSQYADRTGATVNIRFTRVYYLDGRLKRVIIHDCYPLR